MNRFLFFIVFQFFFNETISAQVVTDSPVHPQPDSLQIKDTATIKDSLPAVQTIISISKKPVKGSAWELEPEIPFTIQNINRQILERHPYFGFSKEPLSSRLEIKQFTGKEALFYSLIVLLIIFALLRRAFPKYFSDLFRLFFRTTIKQRQIGEQLMQTPLPSLLLNGFFVISAGLYITFLLHHFKLNPVNNFWLLFLFSALGLTATYLVKFLGLKISGWVFNVKEAANAYIFIVFIINKMIGILLLPFLILLAFSLENIYSVALTLSWIVLAFLFLYRFILTYTVVRNLVKVNPFHFFLYISAFEIAPLLLLYKGLLLYFGIST